MHTFSSLGLSGSTLQGVVAAGYSSPTPIQVAAIPIACAGEDVVGCAQTGTGKTAAFVLPMLQRLSDTRPPRGRRPIRGLVVAPTRELAVQVETSIRSYGAFTRMRSLAVYGGVSLVPQIRALRHGVDLIVATPGRLLDLMDRGHVDLSEVEIVVLDEADRMFDMGFIKDIRKIVAETPASRQTLLFSATMPDPILALTRSIQRSPLFLELGQRRNPAKTVDQQVCKVPADGKMNLLCHILEHEPAESVLVFSRTKHRADRIVQKLGRLGFAAAVMHSNRSQGQRQRALEGFRNGTYQILVATDIAARGLDVDGISHVINYDTPGIAEDYIHRIGRTGRADARGQAITFVAQDEEPYLREIERHTGQRLERKIYDGFVLPEAAEIAGASRDSGRSELRRPSGRGSGTVSTRAAYPTRARERRRR